MNIKTFFVYDRPLGWHPSGWFNSATNVNGFCIHWLLASNIILKRVVLKMEHGKT
jgi:hypothetical protein